MLFCFDVDGTPDNLKMKDEGQYVKGIVPTKALVDLILRDHRVAIVSPSPFYPEGFETMLFTKNGSNDYRWENIVDAMRWYAICNPFNVVYVDDLEGNLKQVSEKIKGIFTYTPQEFMAQWI